MSAISSSSRRAMRSHTATLTSTPSPSRQRSVTRPNPGIFLTGRSRMKRVMAARSKSSSNWPLGLFLSEHICSERGRSITSHRTCLGKHFVRGDTSRHCQFCLLLDLCTNLLYHRTSRHIMRRHVGRDAIVKWFSTGLIQRSLQIAFIQACHHEVFIVLNVSVVTKCCVSVHTWSKTSRTAFEAEI